MHNPLSELMFGLLGTLFTLLCVQAVQAQGEASKPDQLWDKAKQVLAPVDGEITLKGLREPVEVIRDEWGIAHIYAKNTHDLFFAQGFVVSQDRLYQIDIWRRQGAGELAEVFGKEWVEADQFARLMKYRGDMEAEWASYAPDTKEIAEAFTSGINAGIDQFGDKLPIEFQLLGHKPKQWQPHDILGRMSGIYMSQNFRNEIQRARLIAAVGMDKARWLAPIEPAMEYGTVLDADDFQAIDEKLLASYTAATKTPEARSEWQSNNWVISGKKSQSGMPLLASDPHRAIAVPSLRYLVHLNAPGWNVIGSGEPGLPGVAIGHNERIAWGFTIIGTDNADVYVEKTHPENRLEYWHNGKWERMTVVEETIAVRDDTDQKVQMHYTKHGPVIYQNADKNRAYALKWVGSEPGGTAYLASLSVDRANNWNEFLSAMGRWKIPGLNFVYGDRDGNIGWIAAAGTPTRPHHSGLLPVYGDGRFEWGKPLTVADYPQSYNPASGWLATANHNIVPPGFPHRIGNEFAPSYRFDRIEAELSRKSDWKLAEFGQLQHDVTSIPGLKLAKLLAGVRLDDEAAKGYAEKLSQWGGQLTVDSPVGSLFAVWTKILLDDFYSPKVPQELLEIAKTLGGISVTVQALESLDRNWLGEEPEKARDELLKLTFQKAVKELSQLPDDKAQRWGALHTVTFPHPLHKAFDVGPFERSGDAQTPNNTRYDEQFQQIHGATYRHILDLEDWDKGLGTSAPGQSGQPGSPHYDDLANLWAKEQYFPLAFSRGKVDSVAKNKLKLKP